MIKDLFILTKGSVILIRGTNGLEFSQVRMRNSMTFYLFGFNYFKKPLLKQ